MKVGASADLRGYVPRWLLERTAKEASAPVDAGIDTMHAAVIFADIPGFTALTQRYLDKGDAGVEELSLIVSDYLGKLFDVVASFGGDIEDIYGDGFLAFWSFPGDAAGGKENALGQAARCAAEIVDNYDRYRAPGEVEVRIRIAVVVGELFALRVGGIAGQWMFCLAGPCLLQLSDLLARARPGEIAFAEDARKYLALPQDTMVPAGLRGLPGTTFEQRDRPPIPTQEIPSLPPALLECFVPRALLHHGGLREVAWLAEFRLLAVLCICLPRLSCRRPEDLAHIQSCISLIQRGIYRYEGSVLRVSMSEKGPMILAAFGVPNEAHEDDSARALGAAQEVQNALSVTGVVSRSAITNGVAYCGVLGNALRRSYTIMGDVVNRSAKLASSGDEAAIIRDRQTEADARRLGRSSSFGPVEMLAASDAVVATPVASRGARFRGDGILVGREKELEQIHAHLAGLQAGRANQTIHIVGDAGVGKSALIYAIRDSVAGGTLVWHSTTDPLLGAATPYGAWKPIFAALFGNEDWRTPHALIANVRESLERQGESASLAVLANVVLPVGPSPGGAALEFSPEDAARMTRSTLISLLKDRQRARSCIFILEDAHGMDASSWALAEQITRELEHALLILVSRPPTGETPPAQREFFASVSAERLELRPLGRDATRTILSRSFECSSVAPEVVDAIYSRAAGNPFHTIQLGMALREHGALTVEDDKCRVSDRKSDLSIIKLPDTVQRAILARVDRLPADAQLTLKVASVFGASFSRAALDKVLPVAEARDRLDLNLDHVRGLGVIHTAEAGPQAVYGFNHALTQEVLYGLMPFTQRRELHKAVAEYFEEMPEAVRPPPALLGYHWSRAEQPARALPYWEKAGYEALEGGAYREAVNSMSKAVSIMETDAALSTEAIRLGRLRRHLGDAYLQTGDIDSSRQQFSRALICFGYRWPEGPLRTGAELFRQIRKQFWQAVRYRGVLSGERSSIPDWEAARVYESFGQVFGHSTELAKMALATLCALNISQLIGDRRVYSRAAGLLALALRVMRVQRLAQRYFEHCRRNRPNSGEPHDRLMTTEYIAMYHISSGELAPAVSELEAMIGLAEEVHNRRRLCDATSLLILAKLAQSDLQSCAMLLDRFIGETPANGDHQLHCWARLERTELALMLGDVAMAEACLNEVDEVLGDLGNNEKIWAFGLRSLLHLMKANPAQAADTARAAFVVLRNSPMAAFYAQGGIFAACEVLLRTAGQPAAVPGAHGVATEARLMMRDVKRYAMPLPISRPRGWVLLGRYHAGQGKDRAAAACFRRALAESAEQGRPYEQGLAHAGLADLDLAASEQKQHADAAAAIMRKLGVKIDPSLAGLSAG
jgi:tetratricopeptide (TPR) repeat protein